MAVAGYQALVKLLNMFYSAKLFPTHGTSETTFLYEPFQQLKMKLDVSNTHYYI
jgi:hypothetical protein